MSIVETLFRKDQRERHPESLSPLEQKTLSMIDYYGKLNTPEAYSEILVRRLNQKNGEEIPLPKQVIHAFEKLHGQNLITVIEDKNQLGTVESYGITEIGKDALRQVKKDRFAFRGTLEVNVLTLESASALPQ